MIKLFNWGRDPEIDRGGEGDEKRIKMWCVYATSYKERKHYTSQTCTNLKK